MTPTSPRYPLCSIDCNFSMYSCNNCPVDPDADDYDNDDYDNDDYDDDDDDFGGDDGGSLLHEWFLLFFEALLGTGAPPRVISHRSFKHRALFRTRKFPQNVHMSLIPTLTHKKNI